MYLDVTAYIDDLNVSGSIIRKTTVTTKTAASGSETVTFITWEGTYMMIELSQPNLLNFVQYQGGYSQ